MKILFVKTEYSFVKTPVDWIPMTKHWKPKPRNANTTRTRDATIHKRNNPMYHTGFKERSAIISHDKNLCTNTGVQRIPLISS